MTPANPADFEWRGSFPVRDTIFGSLCIILGLAVIIATRVLS